MFMKNFNQKLINFLIPLCVFLFAFLYRIPSLGFDFINNDDHHWKTRGYAFSSAISNMDFAGTAVTYHPGITLIWSQFFAIKTYGILNRAGYTPEHFGVSEFIMNHVLQNVFVVFFTSFLILFLYLGLKKILGRKWALLFVLILCFEPFFTALSRTIHLDTLMSLLMFNAFVYYYLYLANEADRKFSRNLLLAGAFMGLALLTKSAALFLLPFFSLITFLYYDKRIKKDFITKLVILFGSAALIFIAFWPAMWVHPLDTLNLYVFRGIQGVALEEGHEHVWFGQKVLDPGPLFYPIAIVARYSMILVLLFLAGVVVFLKKRKHVEMKSFLTFNLIYWLAFLIMISLTSKKLDRYDLPLVLPMVIFAVFFIKEIFPLTFKKWLLLCGAYAISGLIIFYGLHPNYLAYYSPLVGGYDTGRYFIEPKWLVGYDKVAAYFNSKNNSEKITVAMADKDYIVPFARFQVIDINDEEKRSLAQFFVLPVYRDQETLGYVNHYKLELEDDITVAGVLYYQVYKNPAAFIKPK